MAIGRSERALSEVVGFILLLGVVVAAFSLWLTYVVPSEGREKEIEQMNTVKDRFTEYKVSLDSLWVNNAPPGINTTGVTLSTSFTLGTGGGRTEAAGLFIPLLKPQGSSATMSVRDPGDKITILRSSGPAEQYNMSIVEYQSQNYYWLQQRYYYQLGGVFLSQENGSVNRISPAMSVRQNADNSVSVFIVPIRVFGGGSISGSGPVRIDTTLTPLAPVNFSTGNSEVNISVTLGDTSMARMWNNSVFPGTLSGNVYPGFYNISTKGTSAFIRIRPPGGVILTVRPVDYEVKLNNIASGLS